LLRGVYESLGPDDDLQRVLLRFIGEFANWELSADQRYLEAARGLVKAAHGDEPPLVVDPFAGGGSIPLEALRLGCEAFASDLNPVACLILKTMLEDIPRHGPKLSEELRRVGAEVKQSAEKELAEFYPTDSDGAKPIAYLWARTVRCESPNCGAEIPLVRSFWLCKKVNRRRALRYKVNRTVGTQHVAPAVEFEIFEPKTESEVVSGTVTRAKATCLCCGTVLPPERVRVQLREQRGGADVVFDEKGNRVGGARLLAVVTLKSGEQGRQYRLPAERDYHAVWKATKELEKVASTKLPNGLSPVPDEPSPAGGGSGAGRAFSVQKYGMMTFGDLFTARQKLALVTLQHCIAVLSSQSMAAKEIASLALSRFTDISNALCRWENTKTQVRNLFTRQALPIVWDFAEPSLFGEQAGDYSVTLATMARVIDGVPKVKVVGQVQVADAGDHPLNYAGGEVADVWFTDPPYYDAIPYSDLSDFFFVWLKRTLPSHPLLRDPFDPKNPLTPKIREAVQDETKKVNGRPKDRAFFEETMARAFAEGRRVLKDDGIGCVVFAHKTTEGWEALLSGMVKGGWVATGSWPIATESGTRLRARESAALATSIHLVCRPRPEDTPIGDWADVLRELPNRIGDWMDRLMAEGVRGADLVFACIGPAMEVYSRYSKVEDAEGREIPLGGDPTASEPYKRGFLAYVWETVGRIALGQILGTTEARTRNGAAGALEEDARLTALFLWTLQATDIGAVKTNGEEIEEEEPDDDEESSRGSIKKKGFSLIYDVARRFAQPLGIHLDQWEGRIIATEKGIVRLLPVAERAKQLFGEDGASAVADRLEAQPTGPVQLTLFVDDTTRAFPDIKGRGRRMKTRAAKVGQASSLSEEAGKMPAPHKEATTLDRVHAAMLLQASGRANALRALLKAEQDRGPDFLRLANALSALYPKESEEKRLLDAMLLAVPRT
jgi:adenine-specific DNA methylase